MGPPGPPARLVILLASRKLAAHGAPAPHHRFPEELIDTHLTRSRTAAVTTARNTVVTAMATVTARPCDAVRRSLPPARSVVLR